MPRRRDLKGVAEGILGTFMSRYNDIDGYWALGQLYKRALETGTKAVTIDLIDMTATSDSSLVEQLATRYQPIFRRMYAAKKIPDDWVVEGKIRLTFNTSVSQPTYLWPDHFGDPFLLVVEIKDDLGRLRVAQTVGRCRPHNPDREHQVATKHR